VALAPEKKSHVVVMQVQAPFERSKESLPKMRKILPSHTHSRASSSTQVAPSARSHHPT
jgi:hypothetical protein